MLGAVAQHRVDAPEAGRPSKVGRVHHVAEAMDIAMAPAGVVCVLLERHKQMLVVAMANEAAGNPVTYLPSGLSPEQKCIALALLFLRGMTLPWPPGGPYADEPH